MKEFNLERALAGAKVVTRDEQEVKEVIGFKDMGMDYPVRALTLNGAISYTRQGAEFGRGTGSPNDLFMAPVINEGWINVYPGRNSTASKIHETQVQAIEHAIAGCVATIKITWEE